MSKYQSDPFFQYAVNPAETTKGNVDLPMFFYDSGSYFALFYVDIDKARALIQGDDLEPVEFSRGKTLAVVAAFNYREVGIGPYREVGLAISCVPKGVEAPADPAAALLGDSDSHHMGFYVVNLPVTTDRATAAGIELWGFPKFTTDITFKLNDNSFEGGVADPDGKGQIYTLTGEAMGGAKMPVLGMVYFTRMNGKVLRIHAFARGVATYSLPGSMVMKVGESQHPMARNLASLGLDGARPDFVFYSDAMQLRLPAGAPLA